MKSITVKILLWLFIKHGHLTITTVVLIVLVLAITAIVEGYMDYKEKENAPREEMFICPKGHGIFPRRLCLPLFPHLMRPGGEGPANAYICPTCYKETVFDIPDQRLKNGQNMYKVS